MRKGALLVFPEEEKDISVGTRAPSRHTGHDWNVQILSAARKHPA